MSTDRRPRRRDRALASDPGHVRLALATRAAASLVVVLVVADLVTVRLGLAGPTATVVLVLAAVLSVMTTFTANDPTVRGRVVTQLALPVVMVAGVGLATLVDRHRILSLVTFVAVMFAAVWVRRFGPRAFACGMVAWVGYFIALFLALRVGQLPLVLLAVAVPTVVLLVLGLVVAPARPARRLRRMADSFLARVRIARSAAGTVPEERSRAVLRVNEVAVLVDGQLGVPGAVRSPDRAPEVRAAVLRVEAALARLLDAGPGEGPAGAPDADGTPDADVAARDGRELDEAEHALRAILDDDRHARPPTATTADPADPGARPAGVPAGLPAEFVPAAQLFGGFLPGSAATVGPLVAPEEPADGRRHLALTTRQALQIALAGGLAIVLGDLVSGQRWYWAVLACFLAFTGTATAGETVTKAVQRVVGTVVGVALALALVPLLGQSVPAAMAVILVALFVGFYLFRVAYTALALAVTVIVAELYELLGSFTPQLLALRAGETLLGAAVGCVVAVSFLPTSARSAEAGAHARLAEELHRALEDVARVVETGRSGAVDLHSRVRTLDAAVHQLVVIGVPLLRRASADRAAVRRRLDAWTVVAGRVRAVVHAVEHGGPAGPGRADHDALVAASSAVRALARDLGAGERSPVSALLAPGERGGLLHRELTTLHGALVALTELDGAAPPRPAAGPGPAAAPETDPPTRPTPSPAVPPAAAPVPDVPRSLEGWVHGGDGRALEATLTLVDTAGRECGRTRSTGGRYRLELPVGPGRRGAWQLVSGAAGHAPRVDRVRAERSDGPVLVHDVVLTPTPSPVGVGAAPVPGTVGR